MQGTQVQFLVRELDPTCHNLKIPSAAITDSVNMNLSKFQEIVEDRGAWHAAVHGVTKSWTQLRLKNNNKRKITSGR